jgi:hypothetical protein
VKLSELGTLRSENVAEGFTKNPAYPFQFSDTITIPIPKPNKPGENAKDGAAEKPKADASRNTPSAASPASQNASSVAAKPGQDAKSPTDAKATQNAPPASNRRAPASREAPPAGRRQSSRTQR